MAKRGRKKGFHYGNTLGDYVHLKAKNYLNSGTFMNFERSHKSNYNESIFDNFREDVLNRAKSSSVIQKGSDLKNFQKKFNKNRQTALEKLKNVLNEEGNDNFKKDFFKLLFEKTYNKVTISDEALENWASNLNIGEKGNLILKNLNKQAKKQGQEKIDPIYSFSGKSFAYIDTLIGTSDDSHIHKNGQIKTVERNISLAKIDEDLKSNFKMALGNIENRLKRLNEASINMKIDGNFEDLNLVFEKEIQNIGEEKSKKDYIVFPATKNGRGRISVALANYFYQQIQEIYRSLKIASTFTALTKTFTEFMAALIPIAVETKVLPEKIIEMINKNVKGSNIIKIKSEVKALANKAIAKYGLDMDAFGFAKVEDISKDKIDAVFEMDGKIFNASMKNYNLSAASAKNFKFTNKTRHLDSIGLVSETPLSTLLIAIENYSKNLGTHFLNALTEDVKDNYSSVRTSALNALRIYLLYTALTGGHKDLSIKESDGVNILIIESNTENGYCYFFDISEIISDAVQNLEKADFKNTFYLSAGAAKERNWDESLTNILFENKEEVATKTMDGVNMRIKKILQEAHATKLSAGLSISKYINEKKRMI